MSLERTRLAYVFFSYARQDKTLRDKLEDHLSNLKYRGLIETWHDREISAGTEWARQIDIHLDTADIILLLISSSFMASEYCYSIEMQRALERHDKKEASVIPILLRPVLFTDAPFAKLQFLPSNRKPVVNWRNRDGAFVDIALGIERVVQEQRASGPKKKVRQPILSATWTVPFLGTLLVLCKWKIRSTASAKLTFRFSKAKRIFRLYRPSSGFAS